MSVPGVGGGAEGFMFAQNIRSVNGLVPIFGLLLLLKIEPRSRSPTLGEERAQCLLVLVALVVLELQLCLGTDGHESSLGRVRASGPCVHVMVRRAVQHVGRYFLRAFNVAPGGVVGG